MRLSREPYRGPADDMPEGVASVGAWGGGAVQRVERPTSDLTFDNIETYWSPEHPSEPVVSASRGPLPARSKERRPGAATSTCSATEASPWTCAVSSVTVSAL
ncbi:hypothetical protein GNH96_10310 [Methylococcus geothermalis]|uniref:Glucan biosynthesis periplasmic MdoG C-terminal domain-containing protein n=1 Tax=Methylococcus geothermalis TaxID=2681310 RepID=A0A858Q9G1_9GAMM|nr:hypothetical protein GNH96_10310 [Methylococcus geothermalis]